MSQRFVVMVGVIVVVGLVVIGAVKAIGGSSPARIYESQKYGFSIQYPADFLVSVNNSPKGSAVEFEAAFANPNGATIDGKAVDAIAIEVLKLNKAPSGAQMKAHQRDFENIVGQLVGKLDHLRIVGSFTWTTVGGRPALAITYTYRIQGHDMAARSDLAVVGKRAYWIVAQTSRTTWDSSGKTLASALASLTLQ